MARTAADRAKRLAGRATKGVSKKPKKKSPKKSNTTKKGTKCRSISPVRRTCVRVCTPVQVNSPPPLPSTLTRVNNALKNTEFGRSVDYVIALLRSKPRKTRALGIYGEETGVMLQRFIANDPAFKYDRYDDVIEAWEAGLLTARENTRTRNRNGERVFYIHEYLNKRNNKIARALGDVLFARYTYEDINDNPASSSVTAARLDADESQKIITNKLGGAPIDIFEVLRLFSMFQN